MRWVITEPRGVKQALASPCCEPKPRRLDSIVEAAPLSKVERLDIYAEAYYARLLECLEDDFEVLRRVLGEDIFRGLVAEYLEAHPSTTYTADDLGRFMPEFMRNYELSDNLPYLPELAALEWACVEAFFAPNLSAFDPKKLTEIGAEQWPAARLQLSSSVRLLHTEWAVDDMWRNEKTPALEERRWLVIFRQPANFRIIVRALTSLQFKALELIRAELTLAEICEKLAETLDVEAELPPVMDWFKDWLESGIIADIKT